MPIQIYVDSLIGKHINWLSGDWGNVFLDKLESVLFKTLSIKKAIFAVADIEVDWCEH